ncbi:MAG: TRAP transporter large permease [Lachnospiraceae bacterium]|nr:TRAP transporter large permease [Lachnospiraceae bacterium]
MTTQSLAILVLLGTFILLILLRFPIAYAVGISSVLCLLVQGVPVSTVCQQMVKGINSFSLMAVPFFITMGVLMGSGGISKKLIALADACVGWMTGGMSMVNIVASYFFGGISGSAAADTASLGSILIPMMKEQGYDEDFSTAVTITSSCEGLLVPPSHNMVIFAMAAGGVSVGSLFLAGYIPGAMLALSLMIGSYIISKKRHYPKGEKFSVKRLIKQLGTSFWALAAVLIVVFGVVGGLFTATESAAVAVIYSLLVSVFIYKGLTWKGVWKILEQCIDTLAIVLILIATSNAFGYCLTTLHVPDLASKAIIGLTSNKIVIALLIDLIILVLGCIMDMAPIILIATPILLPIAVSIGINPIQFGIMMVLNCGIGLLTPPVGAVLFIGSAVGKLPMEKVVRATVPFYICMIIVLIMITFIPQISLFLPSLFM